MDALSPHDPVYIGLLHSLTGTMAISEAVLLDAEQMAIDEINDQGGVLGRRVAPLVADGASNPAAFAERASELLAAGATSLFGCWTSASRKAVKPVIEAADSLLWYPVHYEGLEESEHIVYIGACLNQQTIPAIEWALAHVGQRVYLLGTDHVFSRTASRLARALVEGAGNGATVTGERYLPFGKQDFAAVVTAIRDSQPDLVFNTMNGDCNPAFYHQYHAAGISASELPILSVSVSESELYPIRDVAAGHLACWNYFQSLDIPANHEFVRRFRARYGPDRVCSAPMAMAYCAVHLWRQAVLAANGLGAAELRATLVGQSFLGPAGAITVEPNHHVTTHAYVGRCGGDGQFAVEWRSSGPITPLPWLGMESSRLPYAALVREAMASYPDVLDYATRLEQGMAERQLTAEALRQSDEKFRLALRSSPVMVSHQDRDLRYTWVHNASGPFGRADIVGLRDADLVAPESAALLDQVKRRVMDRGEGERTEVPLTVNGRSSVWDLTSEPLRDVHGAVIGVTCASLDVTISRRFEESLRDRLEAQVREQTSRLVESNAALEERAQQLRGLASDLTLAEDRQRRVLRGVLHDHVQQLLVGALMHTDALLRQTSPDMVRDSARRVREIITEAVNSTRSLTWGLSPPILYQLGLGAALSELGQRSLEQYGLAISLDTDPLAEPDSEPLLVLLFRSVQELLLNVAKHAQVSSAAVRLSRLAGDEIQIEVADAGVGFEPESSVTSGRAAGIGLVSLRERLDHLGGRLEIRSSPGSGTSVRLIAPLTGGGQL